MKYKLGDRVIVLGMPATIIKTRYSDYSKVTVYKIKVDDEFQGLIKYLGDRSGLFWGHEIGLHPLKD